MRDADAPEAEIAFEVVDEWQGRGVGKRLVAELAALAREQGILRFRALVAPATRLRSRSSAASATCSCTRYVDGDVELVVRLA